MDKDGKEVVESRSREGAWIEIAHMSKAPPNLTVAPARERGLKLILNALQAALSRRSREGAWIEIVYQRHVPV